MLCGGWHWGEGPNREVPPIGKDPPIGKVPGIGKSPHREVPPKGRACRGKCSLQGAGNPAAQVGLALTGRLSWLWSGQSGWQDWAVPGLRGLWCVCSVPGVAGE